MDNDASSPGPDDDGEPLPGFADLDLSEPALVEDDDHAETARYSDRQLFLVLGLIALLAVAVTAVVVFTRDSSKAADPAKSGQAPTTTATVVKCGLPNWPKLYQGQPANLAAGTDTGFYLWVDLSGWHLRGINTKGSSDFKVVITTSTPIQDTKSFRPIPADAGTVQVQSNVASYVFTGNPTAQGIDFSPCASGITGFRVDLAAGTLPWPANQIWVGPSSKAVDNPVIIAQEGN